MFKISSYFNPYLAAGKTRLDAVLTISSQGAVSARSTGKRVVGFIIDVSGSMNGPKLAQAKLATRRGIDMLPGDVGFFVICGEVAATVLVRSPDASATAKAQAHRLVQGINAGGGTVMSTWLEAARKEVVESGAELAAIYFLTDGENYSDNSARLGAVVDTCKGIFQCDCRGVGDDWKPIELRRISNALLGSADAVCNPEDLAQDFADFLDHMLAKGIAGATLRLWSPKVVRLVTVKQVSPEIIDQMPNARRVDEKTVDIPLGAWGNETRDYQIGLEVPAGAIGEEVLACRASIIYEDHGEEVKLTADPVAVKWSDDDALTTRMSKEVAHYNGQGELAASIQDGLEARARGDEDKATRLLGRAVQLAAASDNDEVTRRLKNVVDIQDASQGTVRLKKADKAAEIELEMGATRTVRRARPA